MEYVAYDRKERVKLLPRGTFQLSVDPTSCLGDCHCTYHNVLLRLRLNRKQYFVALILVLKSSSQKASYPGGQSHGLISIEALQGQTEPGTCHSVLVKSRWHAKRPQCRSFVQGRNSRIRAVFGNTSTGEAKWQSEFLAEMDPFVSPSAEINLDVKRACETELGYPPRLP
jgi:hypothetical protein